MRETSELEADGLPILVNGATATTRSRTLALLIEELGLADGRIAAALNGSFVPSRDWGAARLAAGDRIEIVSPRQGG